MGPYDLQLVPVRLGNLAFLDCKSESRYWLAAAPAARPTGWGFSNGTFWQDMSAFPGTGPPVGRERKSLSICRHGGDGKDDCSS